MPKQQKKKEKSRGAEADPIYLIQGVKFQFPRQRHGDQHKGEKIAVFFQ
ncbi:hypothetical protein [Bacillus velezensis]